MSYAARNMRGRRAAGAVPNAVVALAGRPARRYATATPASGASGTASAIVATASLARNAAARSSGATAGLATTASLTSARSHLGRRVYSTAGVAAARGPGNTAAWSAWGVGGGVALALAYNAFGQTSVTTGATGDEASTSSSPAVVNALEIEGEIPETYSERLLFNYEHRIRVMSAPEKVFDYFASKTVKRKGGREKMMTPMDFIRAISPSAVTRKGRPAKSKGEDFFTEMDVDGDGLISFGEYLVFTTLLAIPKSEVRLCFEMLDADQSGYLDRDEFVELFKVISKKTPQGQASRLGARSVKEIKLMRRRFEQVVRNLNVFDAEGRCSYEAFYAFMGRLHKSVMRLDFDYMDFSGVGTISAKQFALSIVSHADVKEMKEYLERIDTLDEVLPETRFTYKQFKAFNKFVKNVDLVDYAIRTFQHGGGEMDAEALKRVAKAAANVTFGDDEVKLLFHIFDSDGDGDLHPSEFVDLLNKRSTFGLNQKRFLGFTDFIACVRGCFGSSPAAADDPRYFAKSPQDTFAQFATVEHDGQLFMSPVDFMRSVTLSDGGAEQSDHVSVESPAYQFLLQFDHDNDGFISLHEYMFFSTLLAIPSQDLRVAFHMADTDGSGEVDAAEFLALVSSMSMQTGLGAALEKDMKELVETEEFRAVVLGSKTFFGPDGSKTAGLEVFETFASNLHNALVDLEFDYWDQDGKGAIGAKDFARSVVSFAGKSAEMDARIASLGDVVNLDNTTYTLQEFRDFQKFLAAVDDLDIAIRTYCNISGAIKPSDLKRAARAAAGVELLDSQIDILMHVFDSDGNGSLDPEEFIEILSLKQNHGKMRKDTATSKLGCLKACAFGA